MSDDLKEALRLHARDDCNGKYVPTHIANIAADRIAELEAQLVEARTTISDFNPVSWRRMLRLPRKGQRR